MYEFTSLVTGVSIAVRTQVFGGGCRWHTVAYLRAPLPPGVVRTRAAAAVHGQRWSPRWPAGGAVLMWVGLGEQEWERWWWWWQGAGAGAGPATEPHPPDRSH